jgi:hypothetical protein
MKNSLKTLIVIISPSDTTLVLYSYGDTGIQIDRLEREVL